MRCLKFVNPLALNLFLGVSLTSDIHAYPDYGLLE